MANYVVLTPMAQQVVDGYYSGNTWKRGDIATENQLATPGPDQAAAIQRLLDLLAITTSTLILDDGTVVDPNA